VTVASRVNVTAAVAEYLNNYGIEGLGNVYPYPAKFTPEGEFYQGEDPGTQSGALIFMRIESQRERRVVLQGAPPGGKFVTYSLALTILFRSSKKKSQDAGADNDAFLDALMTAIRASKTAGTDDGTVFQWAEGGENGGEDMTLDVYYPRPIDGSITQCNSRLVVQVCQYATS
jgi:hypothetical protein